MDGTAYYSSAPTCRDGGGIGGKGNKHKIEVIGGISKQDCKKLKFLIMKKLENLGKRLSKNQQKAISGGGDPCPEPPLCWLDCYGSPGYVKVWLTDAHHNTCGDYPADPVDLCNGIDGFQQEGATTEWQCWCYAPCQ